MGTLQRNIELLSPAKNIDCGTEAINHGADAVYIGAPKFGARLAAGNSIQDISKLVNYAHLYSAKVYIAFNTLLREDELEEAEKLIWQLYHTGCDALIVQDMGILEMNLPPIPLHASTQMDNRTIEKIVFLEENGFAQVVLPRELSLKQIARIAQKVSVKLEAFVHGALCVSYSGQCYISEAFCKRSANRGECAQYCRLPYTLKDKKGKVIIKDKYLLSLKDLNLSSYLEDLLKAGISSFKIEGRLKDVSYVKNITAYYREKLDKILSGTVNMRKASSGKCHFFFTPDPYKSFNRGFTPYFIEERNNDLVSLETPKSKGEFMGKIKTSSGNKIELSEQHDLSNGDGLCGITPDKNFFGFRVNKVEGKNIFCSSLPPLPIGSLIYRNHNQLFEKKLLSKTSERKIGMTLSFKEIPFGFSLWGETEDKLRLILNFPYDKIPAETPQKEHIKKQLSKMGSTLFEINNFAYCCQKEFFIPASILSSWKKTFIEHVLLLRKITYKKKYRFPQKEYSVFPYKNLSYLGNVSNPHAFKFYQHSGVEKIDFSMIKKNDHEKILMFSKYCLRYEAGICPKIKKDNLKTEPLLLENEYIKLMVEFNCKACEMRIKNNS